MPLAINYDIIGTYAQTEMGHGIYNQGNTMDILIDIIIRNLYKGSGDYINIRPFNTTIYIEFPYKYITKMVAWIT